MAFERDAEVCCLMQSLCGVVWRGVLSLQLL